MNYLQVLSVPQVYILKEESYGTGFSQINHFCTTAIEAGYHHINWNKQNEASGVYFVKLTAHQLKGGQAGDPSMSLGHRFTSQKKVLLVK